MVYKLYSDTAQDAAAMIDIAEDANITAIVVAFSADLDADGELAQMEVSFSSSSGFTDNDSRASLVGARLFNSLLTSGAINASSNFSVTGIKIPVGAGERIYLHGTSTPGTMNANVWLYTDDRSQARPAVRRR